MPCNSASRCPVTRRRGTRLGMCREFNNEIIGRCTVRRKSEEAPEHKQLKQSAVCCPLLFKARRSSRERNKCDWCHGLGHGVMLSGATLALATPKETRENIPKIHARHANWALRSASEIRMRAICTSVVRPDVWRCNSWSGWYYHG